MSHHTLFAVPLLAAALLSPPDPCQASAERATDIRAQDEKAVRDAIRGHLKVVARRSLSAEEKEPAMEGLLELGSGAALQLAAELGRQLERARARNGEDGEKLLRAFVAAAPGANRSRIDRQMAATIQELRALVQGHSRDGGLSKDTVVSVCDPALAKLEELTGLHPNDVWERNEDLFEDLLELQDALADEVLLFEYWSRASALAHTDPALERRASRLDAPFDPTAEEDALFAELAFEAWLAEDITDRDRDTLRTNRALAPELDPEEVKGVERMNRIRLACGRSALLVDTKLCDASRGHSKDMVERGFFSHTSPVPGKESFGQRAALAGTTASAENIAAGQKTGEGAISAWWHSPGHHRNMMAGHRRVGLGRHQSHWTQMFGG